MIRLKVMPLTSRKLGLRKKQITFLCKDIVTWPFAMTWDCTWPLYINPNKVIDGTMIVALYLKSVD